MHLTGCENYETEIKTDMLIYQSMANLDEKISLGKITHQLQVYSDFSHEQKLQVSR